MKKLFLIILSLVLAASCVKKEPVSDFPSQTPQEPAGDPSVDPPAEADKPAPGEYFMHVVQTTDIHGHLVEIDETQTHYRLAYIAKKTKALRERGDQYDKDRLLLLDGGDLYQGASVSNLLAGWPIYTSMEMMDYDAVAVGNHEFDWGFETMSDADATLLDYQWRDHTYENKVPMVCANLYRYGSRDAHAKDYVVVEKLAYNSKDQAIKVKIGVVGYAMNYASSIMTSKFSGMGYSIIENYNNADIIAASLEKTEGCDATVLLTHDSASYAAEHLPQGSSVDLVLGGHTHNVQSGTASTGVTFLQGGRFCEHYAYADLKFVVDNDGNVSFAGVENQQIVAVDANRDYRPAYVDTEIKEVSDFALDAISEALGTVVGYINVSATTSYIAGSGNRSSTMGNWMCDILRRIGEADVAFVNAGGIRTTFPLDGQPARNITVADIYDIFPFDNTVYVYNITYAELLQLFEYSLTVSGQRLFSRMTGIDCRFTTQYKVYSLTKDGTVIYQNGTWTGNWASRSVTLAVSEYVATTQEIDSSTGLGNPLIEWNNTSRLISDSLIDNESAILVLKDEAASSGGLLSIDTQPHFFQY